MLPEVRSYEIRPVVHPKIGCTRNSGFGEPPFPLYCPVGSISITMNSTRS